MVRVSIPNTGDAPLYKYTAKTNVNVKIYQSENNSVVLVDGCEK